MYCGLGAASFFGKAVIGGRPATPYGGNLPSAANRPFQSSGAPLPPDYGQTFPAPVSRPAPKPATAPATPQGDPGVDYGNPATYPGPSLPPPSQGTQNQINSIPASGAGGGAPLVEDGAPSVQSAGLLGGVSPLMLAALAVGAIFALRKRR